MRYTLLAAFCQQRTGEVTDSLVDLLLLVIRRIGAKAEKHVKKQYLDDIQTVEGKRKLLRQVAEAALAGPDKTVRAGIFPVMSEEKCKDFEEKRADYYRALGLSEKAEEFVNTLRQQMIEALTSFDQALPKLSQQVRILDKQGEWISLTPLAAQPEPQNLRRLKGETTKRWGVTSLLDILKEADLRINFTQHFKSAATREVLDRETLQKRLLLCLYGMGTNTGLKRISQGDHGQTHNELIYTRRRYINQEHLRAAIIDVANAIFQVRQPHIWGEGTTTCASDSTQFGSWDQNLMTEWHLRYGGKGVMIYWHVEKHATRNRQAGCLSQPAKDSLTTHQLGPYQRAVRSDDQICNSTPTGNRRDRGHLTPLQ